jgi:hypothetical protein
MFTWPDLDPRTRALMLEEIEHDEAHEGLYIGKRLAPAGALAFAQNLKAAATSGDDGTLAARLRQPGQLKAIEFRGMRPVPVPRNAADVLAEGEFNRFYIRALCRRAIEDGVEELIVFRAKPVADPRMRSEALIGKAKDPHRLLTDLRMHPGMDTVQGLPGGPGSGLSVRLPRS